MTDRLTDDVARYARAVAKHHAERQIETNYTQGPARWSGLDRGIWYPHLPPEADCSSSTTWWIATARHHVRGHLGVDIVNGQRWEAGYTGTQTMHGARHKDNHPGRWKAGRTLCFYADQGSVATHVAMWVDDLIWNAKLGSLRDLGNRGVQITKRGNLYILNNVVISHGQDSGPAVRPWDYRRLLEARAYPV